jgi:hypothetical protein
MRLAQAWCPETLGVAFDKSEGRPRIIVAWLISEMVSSHRAVPSTEKTMTRICELPAGEMSMATKFLNYTEIEKRLFEAFPQLAAPYQKEFSYWVDWDKERPGNYLVFAMVVVPYLVAQLDEPGDGQTLAKLFAFFEEMAASGDPEVVNLLKLEVVRTLVRDPGHLAKAQKHMGHRVRELLSTVQ